MDASEILRLVTDLESDRVERKEALSDVDRVCQAICAFANDLPGHARPGVVAIGVDDAGRPSGLAVDDTLLRRLADLRDNGRIYPFPSLRVDRLALREADIAVVVVEPSTSPPVQFRGRTWVRVGPRRAIATPEEEMRLSERRRGAAVPFDARPIVGATLADLTLDRFRFEILPQLVAADILGANERTVEHQLAAVRFTDPLGTPTPTGLLFVGSDPLDWVPGAYVQFLRIAGTTLADDVVSSHRLTSPLPDAIGDTEEVLRAHIDTEVRFAGAMTEERRASVPFKALQQIVRNAIMHRAYDATNAPVRITWFDDRVEVQSPGGPFGAVTAENFGRPGVTDYRNPTLASALRRWATCSGSEWASRRRGPSSTRMPTRRWSWKPRPRSSTS